MSSDSERDKARDEVFLVWFDADVVAPISLVCPDKPGAEMDTLKMICYEAWQASREATRREVLEECRKALEVKAQEIEDDFLHTTDITAVLDTLSADPSEKTTEVKG